MIEDICQALRTCRLRHGSEKDLQDGIERVLTARGFSFRREEDLGKEAGIIDFLILGRTDGEPLKEPIGVEIKIKGSIAEVARQLHRYAQSPRLGGLVLATTLMRHVYSMGIGNDLNGKPYRMVHLAGSAF